MKRAIDSVNERLLAAAKRRSPDLIVSSQLPRLIAVSKLKPTSSIIEAYECGQRYFGENYIQELVEKSNSSEILEKCPDIKFHFIGHLQSNKVNKLLKVRNLHMVETVDSIKLANLIDKAIGRHRGGEKLASSGDDEVEECSGEKTRPAVGQNLSDRLKIMVQVNTSGEEQKNGIQPAEAPVLAQHIVNECRWLELAGVMTIGRYDGWPAENGPNQDFLRLYAVRNTIAEQLKLEPQNLELSMGMSGDFEEAVTMGSTNVRVGTLIFGERPAKPTG